MTTKEAIQRIKAALDGKEQEAVRTLETATTWTPINEHLPIPSGELIVSYGYEGKYGKDEHIISVGEFLSEGWFVNGWDWTLETDTKMTVEAWMPLPERYKGE